MQATDLLEIPPDRVRHAIEKILAARDYARLEEASSGREGLLKEAIRAVTNFFAGLKADAPLLYTLAVIALLLAALLLVWHVAFTFRRVFSMDEPALANGGEGGGEDAAQGLRRRAEEADRSGRYLEGVRLLLASAVRFIEERLDAESLKGRTNGEVLKRAAALPGAEAPLARLIRSVEDLWFGRGAAGARDFAQCRKYLREIQDRG